MSFQSFQHEIFTACSLISQNVTFVTTVNLRQFYYYFCHNLANAAATTATGLNHQHHPLVLGAAGGGGEGAGGRGEEGSTIKYLYGQMLLNGRNDVRTPDLDCRGRILRIDSDDSLSRFSR